MSRTLYEVVNYGLMLIFFSSCISLCFYHLNHYLGKMLQDIFIIFQINRESFSVNMKRFYVLRSVITFIYILGIWKGPLNILPFRGVLKELSLWK